MDNIVISILSTKKEVKIKSNYKLLLKLFPFICFLSIYSFSCLIMLAKNSNTDNDDLNFYQVIELIKIPFEISLYATCLILICFPYVFSSYKKHKEINQNNLIKWDYFLIFSFFYLLFFTLIPSVKYFSFGS